MMKCPAVIPFACIAVMAFATSLNSANGLMYKLNNEHLNPDVVTSSHSVEREPMIGSIPTAGELRGMPVFSRQGEKIGEIEEVIVDDRTAKMKYLTLSKGIFSSIDDEEIALPLEAVSFQKNQVTLTVDINVLQNAPKQSDLSEEQFRRNLEIHYGVSPSWGGGPPWTNKGQLKEL